MILFCALFIKTAFAGENRKTHKNEGGWTVAIVFLRTIIIYVVLVISLRLMGKRQLGELELSEFVVTVVVADLASNPLQDIGIPLLNGLLPLITLLCCEMLISCLILKNLRFRSLLCGKPSILISYGEVDQREMRKNRFTLDELAEELRNQSITDISKIQFAILETDGKLNTILYPAEQPVTPAQLHLAVDDPGYPTILINDGRVLSDNLRRMGRDERWLKKELQSRGVAAASEVYLLTLNRSGQIYFAAKQ